MADLPPLHAVTVVWLPKDRARPIAVHPAPGSDPVHPRRQLALLRLAAMHLAEKHGLNGADCLRELLADLHPTTTHEGITTS